MNEKLKFLGKRQEKIMQANSLRLRIRGTVRSLRDLLDPTLPEEELAGEEIAQQALELADKVNELKTIVAAINKINEILGPY